MAPGGVEPSHARFEVDLQPGREGSGLGGSASETRGERLSARPDAAILQPREEGVEQWLHSSFVRVRLMVWLERRKRPSYAG